MHLTDRLLCPRCGPPFGLILLAEHSEDGRVREGRLGCPNCRERYPITAGTADLRPPPRRDPPPGTGSTGGDPDTAMRIAALLGLADGPGWVGVLGSSTASVDFLTELAPSVECVALHRTKAPPESDGSASTHMIVADVLPFMPSTFRGLVVSGSACGPDRSGELLGLLVRGGRLLIEQPTPAWRDEPIVPGAELLLDAPEARVLGKS